MNCKQHPCEEPEEMLEEKEEGPKKLGMMDDLWPSVDDMVGWMAPEKNMDMDLDMGEEKEDKGPQMPWPMNAGLWMGNLPDNYELPGPFNPRDFDEDPWPLDAGLIPFALRIPEEKTKMDVDEFFGKNEEPLKPLYDLPAPWPRGDDSVGVVPF